jgi:hypothetical protein
METGAARLRGPAPFEQSTISNIHRDFHAEPEINGLRGFPFHKNVLRVSKQAACVTAATTQSCAAAPHQAKGIIMKYASRFS